VTAVATVVVAPDSFKGTMSAVVVADALAAGVRDAGGSPVIAALADGGEGTAEVLRKVLVASTITIPTTGPLGQPIDGSFLLSDDGRTAVVETATARGLHMSSPTPGNAEAATTYGTGVLIAADAATGASDIWVGVGGSASTDGGRGALRAIADAGGLCGEWELEPPNPRPTRLPTRGTRASACRTSTRRCGGEPGLIARRDCRRSLAHSHFAALGTPDG
jgi:glycerate kinase